MLAQTQNVEALSDTLIEAGALSVTLEDAEDNPVFEPLPEEIILWEKTLVSAVFPADHLLDKLVLQLQVIYMDMRYQIEPIVEKDWEKVWIEESSPLCFQNYLWVCSSVCEPTEPNQPVVRLDPGLAFGTGTHPTTALCLDWLATNPPKKKLVIDYGCGSGILAIAALKLGAKRVYAVDHDSQARTATKNNAAINQIDPKAIKILSQHAALPLVDVLLANILANPLVELSAYFATRVKSKGQIVLSGILVDQFPLIYSAYQPYFASIESKEQDGWLVVTCQFPMRNKNQSAND